MVGGLSGWCSEEEIGDALGLLRFFCFYAIMRPQINKKLLKELFSYGS
jgi:hypothetical protein